jgi:hypothetical protein
MLVLVETGRTQTLSLKNQRKYYSCCVCVFCLHSILFEHARLHILKKYHGGFYLKVKNSDMINFYSTQTHTNAESVAERRRQ